MSAGSVFRDLLVGHVAPAALPALVAYAELLDRWSDRHNLVRFASPRELVERHLLDAVEGTRLLAGEGRLLDVGSGAGLPGVPLLITRPAWRGVLLEPRQKRWAFLKRVVRELGLDAARVMGHRELEGTGFVIDDGEVVRKKTCPGEAVDLDRFRQDVAEALTRPGGPRVEAA